MDLNTTQTRKQRNTILADMGLLCVALIWGGAFVACKFALTAMTPMNLMAYRYMGAAIVVFLFCLKKLRHLKNKRVLWTGAVCGFIMFLGNSLQIIGLQYTTAGKQSFIISLYIILVPLMNWILFRSRPANHILIAAIVGFIGISLITLTDQLTIGKGDLMTFGFALLFSIQIIFTSRVVQNIDAMVFTFIQMLTSGVLSSITALLVDTPVSPATVMSLPFAALLGLVYLAVFNSAMAFLLQNICLKFAPANHSAIIMSMETVFGTIFAVTIAGEIFAPRMIAGCALMFLAIAITELSAFRKTAEKSSQPAALHKK